MRFFLLLLKVIYIYIYIYTYIYTVRLTRKLRCSATCYGSDIKAIKLFCSGYICFGIVRHLIRPYNKMP